MKNRSLGIFAIVVMIAMVIGTLGMVNATNPIAFEKENYEGNPGDTVSLQVNLANSGFNTSASDIIDVGYISSYDLSWVAYSDDEIADISDYDGETGVNQTYWGNGSPESFAPAEPVLTLYPAFGVVEFNITPITSFDGIMVKKSVGLQIGVTISNNTNGFSDSEYGVVFTDENAYFPTTINTSYKFVDHLEPLGMFAPGDLSIEEWVATYGSIDHISLWERLYSDDHYCTLDEFHLFDTATTLKSYSIINEDNVSMAWGTTATKMNVGEYILQVHIPTDATLGNYFVSVKDSAGNIDTTTLSVVSSQAPINKRVYVFVIGFLGFGLIGGAMLLARKKRKETGTVGVIIFAVAGVLMVFIASVMALYLLGYITFGFGLIILPMMVALKGRFNEIKSFCTRNKKILSIGILGILLCSSFATVMATDTSIPTSQSIQPGDSFTISIASNSTTFTATNVICNIEKVDQTTPAYIYWKYTVVPSTDKKTADINFVTTEAVAEGTYIIHIHSGEYFSQYVTVYIASETNAFNWNLWYFTFFGSIAVLIVGSIGLMFALKTKTHKDDYLMIFVLLIGVLLFIFSIALFMGWLSIYGFSGALAIMGSL